MTVEKNVTAKAKGHVEFSSVNLQKRFAGEKVQNQS